MKLRYYSRTCEQDILTVVMNVWEKRKGVRAVN